MLAGALGSFKLLLQAVTSIAWQKGVQTCKWLWHSPVSRHSFLDGEFCQVLH